MNPDLYFDGKKYVSSRRAAEISMFSADYIGQLCRLNKLESRLVNRVRYVNFDSLQALISQDQNNGDFSPKPSSSRQTHKVPAFVHSDTNTQLISAKSLAEKSGYSADYIGQLCRTGKLESQLIDRVRYIAPGSWNLFLKNLEESQGARTQVWKSETVSPQTTLVQEKGISAARTIRKIPLAKIFTHSVLISSTFLLFFALASTTHTTQSIATTQTPIIHRSSEVVPLAPNKPVSYILSKTYSDGSTTKILHTGQLAAALVSSTNGELSTLDSSGLTVYRFFNHKIPVLARWFGSTPKSVVVPQVAVTSTTPTPVAQTKFIQPLVQNITQNVTKVEKTTITGVSEEVLYVALNQLNNKIQSDITAFSARQSTGTGGNITNVYQQIANSQKIDNLYNTTITNPTINGGSISNTSISATDLASSGNTTLANATIASSTTTNGYIVSLVADSGTITNFLSTNSTTTNATSTNLFATNGTFTNQTIQNLLNTYSTTTSATSTNLFANNFTGFNATVTNLTATGTIKFQSVALNSLLSTDSSGNVVATSTPTFGQFFATSTTATNYIAGLLNVTGRANFVNASTTMFTTTGSTYLATTGGNVGVGTTSPIATLAVNGDTFVTGNSTTTGNSFVNGSMQISKSTIPLSGTIYFGTNMANYLNFDGSNFMFNGTGALFTAGSQIIAQSGSNAWGIGAKYNAGTGTVYFGATNSATPDAVFSNNAGTERMRLTDGGNLGLGSTTPGYKLSVAGSGYFDGGSVVASVLTATSSISTPALTLSGAAVNSLLSTNASGAVVATSTPTFGNLIATSTTLASTFAYNVGIGTTNASQRLTVSNTSNRTQAIFGAGYPSGKVGIVIGAADVANQSGNISYDVTNNKMAFQIAGMDDQVVLTSAGNLGIGTTNPGQALEVYGALKLTANPSVTPDTLGGYFWNQSGIGPTIGGYQFEVQTNGSTPALRINSGGNVGIGSTAPVYKLDVVGTGHFTGAVTLDTAPVFSGVAVNSLLSTNSSGVIVATSTPTFGQFFATSTGATNYIAGLLNVTGLTTLVNASTTQLTSTGSTYLATTGGNVGIGTTAPTQKLHVVGNSVVSGNMSVGLDSSSDGYQLDIQNTGNQTFYLHSTTAGGGGYLMRAGSNGDAFQQYYMGNGNQFKLLAQSSDNSFRITDANTPTHIIMMDTNGYVGIGTSAPVNLLTIGSGTQTTAANGLSFGTDTSANLYRSAASTIKTDGNLVVAGTLTTGATTLSGVAVNSLLSTNASGVIVATSTPTFGQFFATSTIATNYIAGLLNVTGLTTLGNASTTQITSTGSTYLATGGGNVGIGTTAPVYPLEVKGRAGTWTSHIFTSSLASGLSYGELIQAGTNSSDTSLAVNDQSGTLAYLTVLGNGNVGIGTGSPSGLFDIEGSGKILLNGGNVGIGTTAPGGKLDVQGGRSYFSAASEQYAVGARYVSTGGTVYFGATSNSSTPDAAISNAGGGTLMTLQNGGNIGMGTTAPGAPLDVQAATGFARITSTTGTNFSYLRISNTGGNSYLGNENSSGGSLTVGGLAYATVLQTDAARALQFGTSNTARMTIDSSGNVGVGTTAPGSKFEVNGNMAYTAGTGSTQDNYLYVGAAGSLANAQGSTWQVRRGYDNISLVTVTGTGNVGIGTTAPNYKLHVQNSGSAVIQLSNDTVGAGTSDGFQMTEDTSGNTTLSNREVGYMLFGTSDTERMRILSGGNVGIGTSAPTQKLEVVGNIYANSGWLYTPNGMGWANDGAYRVGFGSSGQVLLNPTAGNVGIGTTVPARTLDVSGTARISGALSSEANYDSSNDSLVYHIPFAEGTGTTASDKSKTGSNGTITAGSGGWTTGKVGNAYSFDGSATYVTSPTISIATNITAEAWVYSTNYGNGMFIVEKAPVNAQWEIFFESGSLKWRVGGQTDLTCTAPTNSTWHHVAATQSATAATLYIDGVQCATTASVVALPNGSGPIYIGKHDADSYYFSGKIDEVKLYNRVLSADDIRNHYLSQSGTNLAYIDANANVGIGTTAPIGSLEIYKSGTVALQLYNAAATSGSRNFELSSQSNLFQINPTNDAISSYNATGLVMNSSGNVGIGTSAPGQKMDVLGASAYNGTFLASGALMVRDSASALRAVAIGYDPNLESGFIQAGKSGTGYKALLLNPNGGNVGIGTTAPAAPFDVTAVGDDATPVIRMRQSNAITYGVDLGIDNNVNGGLVFNTVNAGTVAAAMTIARDTGYVGIGTTAPLGQLHTKINSASWTPVIIENTNAGGAGGIQLRNDGTGTSGQGGYVMFGGSSTGYTNYSKRMTLVSYANGAAGTGATGITLSMEGASEGSQDLRVVGSAGGSPLFLVQQGGNVGIGSASPTQKLDVVGLVRATDSTSYSGAFMEGSNGQMYMGSLGNDVVNLYTGSAVRLSVLSGGNVGIGSASPGQKLDVNGDVNVAGQDIFFNGTKRFSDSVSSNYTDIQPQNANLILYDAVNDQNFRVYNSTGGSAVHITRSASVGTIETEGGTANLALQPSTGNVGVGTTNPLMKLDVQGGRSGFSAASEQYSVCARYVSTGGCVYFGATSNSSTPDAAISNAGGGTLMTLQNGGNVGIGNTSPTAKLSVGNTGGMTTNTGSAFTAYGTTNLGTSATNYAYPFEVYNTAGNSIRYQIAAYRRTAGSDYTGAGWRMQYAVDNSFTTSPASYVELGNGNIYLGTGTTDVLSMIGTNVGIGTTVPVSKLHIHGNYGNDGTGGFTLDASDNSDPERYVLRINPYVVGSAKVGYAFQTKSATGGTNIPLALDNAGNVGIGTTVPWSKLSVLGSSAEPSLTAQSAVTAAFGVAASTELAVSNSGNSPFTISLQARHNTVNSNTYPIALNPLGGNVGVGTTNPGSKFVVSGTADTQVNISSASPRLGLSNNDTWGSRTIATRLVMSTSNGDYGINSGQAWLFTEGINGGTAGNLFLGANSLQTITLSTAGNVGVSSASPGEKLDVTGNIRSLSDANNFNTLSPSKMTLRNTTNTSTFEVGLLGGTGDATAYLYNRAAAGMVFGTSNNARMTIDSGGNVGIGVTPGALLQVGTNVGGANNNGIYDYNSPNAGYYLLRARTEWNDGNGGAHFSVENSSGQSMIIDNNRNVGIGTSAPGSSLDIYRDAGSGGATELRIMQARDTDGYTRLRSYQDSSGFALSSNWAQGSSAVATASYAGTRDYTARAAGQFGLQLDTSAAASFFEFAGAMSNTISSLVRIQLDGNVGIGTTAPKGKLDVYGDIYGSQEYSFGGYSEAANSWDTSGLATGPTASSTTDDSWYIKSTSQEWTRGLLSRRRFQRTPGLTLEWEAYAATDVSTNNIEHYMVGFADGTNATYSYAQTPANLLYNANGTALYVYDNGNQMTALSVTQTIGVWTKYKIVLNGSGASYYYYAGGKWNLLITTTTNSTKYLRVLVTDYVGLVNFRNMRVYQSIEQPIFSSLNILGSLTAGAGASATGVDSVALGVGASATGLRGIAIGDTALASNQESIAIGSDMTVSGAGSLGINLGVGSTATNVTAAGVMAIMLGNVGIGTINPQAQFELSGSTAQKASGTTWSNPSDQRLKTNVTSFTDGLNVISQINPVNYTLNGLAGTPLGQTDIGVIAQQIKDVAPYTVSTYDAKLHPEDATTTSLYRFNASALTFVSINAIKDINSVINVSAAVGHATSSLTVLSNGFVGVGTTTPSNLFSVFSNTNGGGVASFTDINGTCTIDPTNAALVCSSDANLKKDIVGLDATTTLDKLMNVRGVQYHWNREGNAAGLHTGFIAQNVEEQFPEFVTTNADGTKAVAYSNFVPALVAGMQALNTKVNTMDTRLMHLETLIGTSTDMVSSGGMFSQITSWFASATNGIGDFFANRVRAKEICVSDNSGETCITKNQLDSLLANVGSSGSGNGTTTPPVDTSSPVITLNGDNPATITVGTSYVDLGATVTDTNADGSVNNNLGLHFSVDGTDVNEISIDTASSTTHTIVYSAVDSANNWAYATRTVEVAPQ